MGYDPRSAAVIALCIGGILVAAALFPAAGMTGTPGSADGGVPDTRPGDGSSTENGTSPGEMGGDTGTDGADDGSGSGNGAPGTDDAEPDGDRGSGEENTSADDPGTSGPDEKPPYEGETAADSGLVGLILAILGVVAGLLVLGGVVTAVARHSNRSSTLSEGGSVPLPDGPLPRLSVRLARIPQLTMIATISLGRRATSAGAGIASIGQRLARTGLLAGVSIRTGLRSLTTVSIGLPSFPRLRVPSIGWPTRSDGERSGSRSRRASTQPGGGSATERDAEPASVEDAWRRLVASLAVRRPAVRTPRECAAIAIDAGYPPDAVETLTGTFEAVRYGDAARTPDLLDRVRNAYDRVREANGGDGL